MSRIFFIAALFSFVVFQAAAQNASPESTPNVNGPLITWEKTAHEFGDITQGEKVEHVYSFTNTGNEPLIITNVEVTCGCTVPKGWPRDPIAPGGKGEILIVFNSTGKFGRQNKVITIISNAANPAAGQVTFSANVLEKKSPN